MPVPSRCGAVIRPKIIPETVFGVGSGELSPSFMSRWTLQAVTFTITTCGAITAPRTTIDALPVSMTAAIAIFAAVAILDIR